MAEVRIEHIYKRFGGVTAVDDFNLVVADGEFVSILGPSGCGKTTTLRMIAGFERASEGEIYIGDTCVSSSEKGTFAPPEKRDIGMVFQSYAVWPHMTVAANVGYPLKIKKVPHAAREERVREMLGLVHLEDYAERYPHQLSGGQQQRVALARALVAHPGLLLLDEPLSNLDAKLRESMRFEILALQKELGITVVYVTHDQGEAMAMSDRVVVMSKGLVQQIGAPHEIYTDPANKMVADFIGLVNFLPGEVRGGMVYVAGMATGVGADGRADGLVTVAIRPENIILTADEGTVGGVLTHRFYLGDAVDYRIKLGEELIRVIQKGADLDRFQDGQDVRLSIEKVLLFERE